MIIPVIPFQAGETIQGKNTIHYSFKETETEWYDLYVLAVHQEKNLIKFQICPGQDLPPQTLTVNYRPDCFRAVYHYFSTSPDKIIARLLISGF